MGEALSIPERWLAKRRTGAPLLGGGIGTVREAEALAGSGLDFLSLDHSRLSPWAGRDPLSTFMAYGNANRAVLNASREIVAAAGTTPLLAGVCATDPYLLEDSFLKTLRGAGVTGVQNYPSVAFFEGAFRADLEESGTHYQSEVRCLRRAKDMGLLAAAYVSDAEEARQMTDAGADMVIVHPGWPRDAGPGLRPAKSAEDFASDLNAVAEAAKSRREGVFVLWQVEEALSLEELAAVGDSCDGLDGMAGPALFGRNEPAVDIARRVGKLREAWAGTRLSR